MSIPEPIFKDNIPKKVEEVMFANDFSNSSGNTDEDNNLVGMIDRSIQNNAIIENQELEAQRQAALAEQQQKQDEKQVVKDAYLRLKDSTNQTVQDILVILRFLYSELE